MHPEHPRPPLDWPELSDEAVVTLYDLITELIIGFESRYCAQLHRHFHERTRQAHAQPDLIQPDLFSSLDPDEPPF